MNPIAFLEKSFAANHDKEAIIWQGRSYHYGSLNQALQSWSAQLQQHAVTPGSVVAMEADFSPQMVALFLALVKQQCLLVPIAKTVVENRQSMIDTAQVEHIITLSDQDQAVFESTGKSANHEFFQELRQRQHPGLVLFSSGSTGKSKAAVHDLVNMIKKFETPKRSFRTISFLLSDHIGGVNTMLYTLSNTGCLITIKDRHPRTIMKNIQDHQVELLPTSPTFINLLLLSEDYKKFDLSSLQRVTYGTEPMPASTLERFHKLFPGIKLQQTYGLSELGILRSKSKESNSLWVKIGGEGFATRMVDNILQIKAHSAMLGYLNAPSPFTEDGWFNTQDVVEQQGEYFLIHGRETEIINVGGEKVYPAEVESVLQNMPEILEVTVAGEKNAITGQVVAAWVRLKQDIPKKEFSLTLKKYCQGKLDHFKIPARVHLSAEALHSSRFKKKRSGLA